MKFTVALCLVVALVACASAPPVPGPAAKRAAEFAAADPAPADYEIRIISWLRMNTDDPDRLRVLSIGAPQLKTLESSAPEKGLEKGDPIWEAIALTQGYKGDPPQPVQHRFYFKEGVIRAVDLK
jgi:hypothetical protein